MALPEPFTTSELENLISALGANPLTKLENLHPEDLILIGALIQNFNFIEFNLRRSVSSFVNADLIQQPKRLMPSDLVKVTVSAVALMDPTVEDISDTTGRLNELEFRRPYRNLLAHWAAKRIREHDALYLMSCDGRDAEQSGIGELDHGSAGFAIILLPDLRGLAHHIGRYERWLAQKTADWYERFSK